MSDCYLNDFIATYIQDPSRPQNRHLVHRTENNYSFLNTSSHKYNLTLFTPALQNVLVLYHVNLLHYTHRNHLPGAWATKSAPNFKRKVRYTSDRDIPHAISNSNAHLDVTIVIDEYAFVGFFDLFVHGRWPPSKQAVTK